MQLGHASLGKVCASCGRNNANALKYCLTCGQQFSGDSVLVYGPDLSSPSLCKQCGIDDPYNEKFCLACGSELPLQPTTQKSDVVNKPAPSDKQRPSVGKSSFAHTIMTAHPPGIASGALFTLLAACGAALGIGAAFMLNQHHFIQYAANRIFWPRSGLIVYASPAHCEASVSTLDRKRVLMAKADRYGHLKFGALTEGDYRLTLTAPGYETIGQIVKVVANRPTILGYPDPVNLPSLSSKAP